MKKLLLQSSLECFITLSTIKDGVPKPFTYEQSFWVSSIVKSPASPSKIASYQLLPANLIVNDKTTGFAKAMSGLALVGATGALVAADAALAEKNDNNNE